MFADIVAKLDYEYNRFYEEKRRASKDNIFGSSYEIEAKKTIVRALKKELLSKEAEDCLLKIPNLIDNIYAWMEKERCYGKAEVLKYISFFIETKDTVDKDKGKVDEDKVGRIVIGINKDA
jgi:hypothetical protein